MTIEIVKGDTVQATMTFYYSGPAGVFTLAQELGTVIAGPPLPESTWIFDSKERWELAGVSVAPGANTKLMNFVVTGGGFALNVGTLWDMNFEIGTGVGASWSLKKRVFTPNAISIVEAGALFSGLVVTYRKV